MSYIFKERNPPPPWAKFKARAPHSSLVPVYYLSWLIDWAAYLMAKWPMVELLEYLGSFSILFAAIFYFADSPDRLKQKHYQAWQVINTAQGKGGNGGRVDALQELNEDHVALTGVDVDGAYLEGLQLPQAKARRANFSSADLRSANFDGAGLEDADFVWANLRAATLRGAMLAGADFQDADLFGASLARADLAGVSFDRAELHGVDLDQARNWQSIKGVKGANIYGILHAPDGFAAWARKMGAVETNSN